MRNVFFAFVAMAACACAADFTIWRPSDLKAKEKPLGRPKGFLIHRAAIALPLYTASCLDSNRPLAAALCAGE